jgi:hypothetical protein
VNGFRAAPLLVQCRAAPSPSDAVSTNGIIKRMKNPHIGQRVWADGLTGTFTVVQIYEYQGTADLELTTGTQKIEIHIPLTAIHPARVAVARSKAHRQRA